MQHLAPFTATTTASDLRRAAMGAHPSAQPSASGPSAAAPAHRSAPRTPMAAVAPDPSVSGRPAWAPTVAPTEDGPGTHRERTVATGPEAVRSRALATGPEEGSLVTEYGLLAVVAATVAGVVIEWASGGALVTLFNALLRHARSLVGA